MASKPCTICETTLRSGDIECPECKHCVVCRDPQSAECACFELHLCQVCGRELDTLRVDPEENTYCVKCDPDTPRRKRDTSPKRPKPRLRKQLVRRVKQEPTPPKPKSMSRHRTYNTTRQTVDVSGIN